MDYYKNFKNLEKAFTRFINKTPPIGKSLVCIDDKNIKKIVKKVKNKNILFYGFDKKANYRISNARYHINYSLFDLNFKNSKNKKIKIKNINLKLIGEHNVLNATSAIAVCLNLGVKINVIKRSLKNFSGVQRRMTKILVKNKNEFFDDYASSYRDKSILESINAVYRDRKIISVFAAQIFKALLKNEFSKSFKI